MQSAEILYTRRFLFAAESQKALGIWYNCCRVDRHTSVSDSSRIIQHGYCSWILHTMGHLPRPSRGKSSGDVYVSDHIPVTGDTDGVLLLQDCLQTEEQGSCHVVL